VGTEERIEEERRKKRAELEELGVNVYPTRFARTHTISAAVSTFEGQTGEELEQSPVRVRTAGRIMAVNRFGKAGFVRLSDGATILQVFIRRDVVEEPGFAIYKKLDLGDFVGVEGVLFRTKTDELTIKVEQLTFLAKALRPLPEKWHGLADVEMRYRQRYLDLLANKESRDAFVTRSRLIQEIRNFFNDNGYIEVETPMLQPVAGGAVARPFKTFHNALGIDLFMRIAPELYLKRLTVGGLEKVYEINRNFRNEGISTRHNPEFTMLEFYEAYSDVEAIMSLTEQLFERLGDRIAGGHTLAYGEESIDISTPFARLPVLKGVEDGLKAKGVAVQQESLRTKAGVLEAASELSLSLDPAAPWGKLLMGLFDELVEPTLIQPTFVIDYPVDVSPFSKKKPDDPALVERFELFIAGMECANGFSELNDPDDQRARFEAQLMERERGDSEAHSMDEDYLRALSHGLPPTGGEGLGIDRVAMLFTDSASIRDVILFPHLRPEQGLSSTEE